MDHAAAFTESGEVWESRGYEVFSFSGNTFGPGGNEGGWVAGGSVVVVKAGRPGPAHAGQRCPAC